MSGKIVALILILILIAGGAFLLLRGSNNPSETQNANEGGVNQTLKAELTKFKANLYNGSINVGNSTTGPGVPLVYIGAPPDQAEVVVMVFYDMKCPYCALEFQNATKVLAKYLEKYDNISVILAGLIIHEDVKEYHAYIRCLAQQHAPILAILYEYYTITLNNQAWPSMEKLKSIASEYGNWSVSDDCIQKELQNLVRIDIWSLDTLQVHGTPTLIVQSEKLDTAYVSSGLTSPDKLDSLLASLIKGEQPNLG